MPIRNGQIVNWRWRVNIKPFITEDIDYDAMPGQAKQIRAEFGGILLFLAEEDIDTLEDVLGELQDAADEKNLNWYNGVLDSLYDWADANLVWLGI